MYVLDMYQTAAAWGWGPDKPTHSYFEGGLGLKSARLDNKLTIWWKGEGDEKYSGRDEEEWKHENKKPRKLLKNHERNEASVKRY